MPQVPQVPQVAVPLQAMAHPQMAQGHPAAPMPPPAPMHQAALPQSYGSLPGTVTSHFYYSPHVNPSVPYGAMPYRGMSAAAQNPFSQPMPTMAASPAVARCLGAERAPNHA